MLIVRQSTARTVTVGPVLDADGVAVTGGVVADFKGSVNGGAPGALNGSATLTHRSVGFYSLALTATDLATVGSFEVVIDDTVNACPMKELTVIEEAIYDALFAASANAFAGAAGATTLPAVASVTGAVGSVTGNVGGNVTGSVGSVATGGITAASLAADAITAAKVAADVGTEIGAAVLAAATAAPIAANVKAVNAVTLTGVGTSGNPWGPA
jgi:hypothetical protein